MTLTKAEERAWSSRVNDMYLQAAKVYDDACEEDKMYRKYLVERYSMPLQPIDGSG